MSAGAVCLAMVGLAFYTGTAGGYWVLAGILLYISFFAISLGPLTFVVVAEIFPNQIRGRAMGVAIFFSMAFCIRGITNLPDAAGINRQRLHFLDIYGNLSNGLYFYPECCARNQGKNTGTDTGDVEEVRRK